MVVPPPFDWTGSEGAESQEVTQSVSPIAELLVAVPSWHAASAPDPLGAVFVAGTRWLLQAAAQGSEEVIRFVS